ncbi:hypothetical protein MIR68_005581 [Amoeboaphelidium protococcarum]|nr:hypothetical protein MIR68_005581 [Amoeboaphelidium protococcarum]
MSHNQTTTSGRHSNFTPLFQQFVIEQNERRAQLPSNPNPPPQQKDKRAFGFNCVLATYGFWHVLPALTSPTKCLVYGIGLAYLSGKMIKLIDVYQKVRYFYELAEVFDRFTSGRSDTRGNTRRDTRRDTRHQQPRRSQVSGSVYGPAIGHQNQQALIIQSILDDLISPETIAQWLRDIER